MLFYTKHICNNIKIEYHVCIIVVHIHTYIDTYIFTQAIEMFGEQQGNRVIQCIKHIATFSCLSHRMLGFYVFRNTTTPHINYTLARL